VWDGGIVREHERVEHAIRTDTDITVLAR